ncbi:Zinc-binding GTPase YeiR [Sinobacterium norvegicum]|uniref:Zinc-binding GTPase YeiR n=1 Tax=Sinobacterium norvegicum TaxID=1641715 RepID=A0ABN8EJ38_9GAMM|nr:GTP-binding protein [Sinobacterium norvegicum]CAH0992372.1 Zinc-binding GTPase YeiR [Sinobacterium norvegicum]
MKNSAKKLNAIPTNIITGFLGAGKTSAILHLLKAKPADERWAVLVNEFGEIGVDGSLFQGQHSEQQQVYIREVAGGCMCCAAGLPMNIALSQLLTRARPHRLLIEPSGLGHPIEVLAALSTEYYREVLSVEKILTLVDARKLSDERYTGHTTFNQQIAIADVIVGNKQDLYQDQHKTQLAQYVKAKACSEVKIVLTEQGRLTTDLLQGGTTTTIDAAAHQHQQQPRDTLDESPLPACGYIKAENKGDDFGSIGWRFEPEKLFNRDRLLAFLNGLEVERMKAVFITEQGIYGYNLTSDALTEVELDDCMQSRVEIIASEFLPSWEQQLLACIEPAD